MEEPGQESSPLESGNRYGLLLSLYLLLLAFFVVLHSISQRDDTRSQAAIDSLTAAFRLAGAASPGAQQVDVSSSIFLGRLGFDRELRQLFARELPAARIEELTTGDAVRVTVAADALFVPGTANLKLERSSLIEGLAGVLEAEDPEEGLDVKIVALSGVRLPQPGGGANIEVRRAAALVRALWDHRASGVSLAAGVQSGRAGIMHLYFAPRGNGGSDSSPDEPGH